MKKELLDNWISENYSSRPHKANGAADDTVVELVNYLLHQDQWKSNDHDLFDFLTRKVEIHGRLHAKYTRDGKPETSARISDEENKTVVILLARELVKPPGEVAHARQLKLFNALFKSLDISQPAFLDEKSNRDSIDALFEKIIPLISKPEMPADLASPSISKQAADAFGSDLTILFSEGPIGRAYLAMLANLGIKPKLLIHLVYSIDLQTKKPVGAWLPNFIRGPYCASMGYNAIHFWPQKLQRQYPDIVSSIKEALAGSINVQTNMIAQANSNLPLNAYAEKVETVFCTGLRDQILHTHLSKLHKTTLLFTGGGIVSKELLALDQLNYLHIHPGYLPDLRGADCTLWSKMIAGMPSASAIFLNSGIDTGDILSSVYLPDIEIGEQLQKVDESTAYRLVYSFVDPWVRAACLQKLLSDHSAIGEIKLKPQKQDSGATFHFMHKKIRQAVFNNW